MPTTMEEAMYVWVGGAWRAGRGEAGGGWPRTIDS